MNEMMRYPLSPLPEMVSRLFDMAYVPGSGAFGATMTVPLDVQVTPEDFILYADVHGMTPKDVHVEVQGEAVTIWGEMKPAASNGHARYLVQERTSGKFRRTVTLPAPVEAAKAEAVFENGLLTLRLPKAEAVRPKTIAIRTKK